MGILNFLSKLFNKEELQTFENLNAQFESLLAKSGAQYLALMGVKGKIKGLDLITVFAENGRYNKDMIKRFNAKLVEAYLRFQNLGLFGENPPKLHYINYYYEKELQFYIVPMQNNDSFIITSITHDISKVLQNIEKLEGLITKLKAPEDETKK